MIIPSAELPFDDETWLVSDTHFFHANIGQYCSRPDGWQDLILDNWNHHIQPGDTVFHLGDLALGKKENLEALAPLLNGNLYLMRGNHDRRSSAFYQNLGIKLVKDPYRLEHGSGMRLVFSHRPIIPLLPGMLNLHGHIHNNPTLALGPRYINLSIEVRQYRPWKLGDVLRLYMDQLVKAGSALGKVPRRGKVPRKLRYYTADEISVNKRSAGDYPQVVEEKKALLERGKSK